MMKKFLTAFAAAAVLCCGQYASADVIGATYTVEGNVWTDGFTAGFTSDAGTQTVTFDGTTKVLGALAFGNVGDQMLIQESQTLDGDGITFTIDIFMFAVDGTGALTTWAAPGTTVDDDGDPLTPEVPLAISFFDMAQFDAGTDTLDVNVGTGTYTFVDSNALIVSDAGDVFAFADGADPLDGTATGNFSASVGFNAGDLSADTAALGAGVAGYGFTWTYTLVQAIPEPSSGIALLIGALGFVVRRRR